MAAATSLTGLFNSLTQSLTTTLEATPKLDCIEPPENGISLLDVKNELLLSYLQNLVFLILLKLRQARGDAEAKAGLDENVVNKLVELRLYLEKGVRPLEDKLRYRIETVLRAASDAERRQNPSITVKSANGLKKKHSHPASGSESDGGSEKGQGHSGAEHDSGAESEKDEDDDDEQEEEVSTHILRPNLGAMAHRIPETRSSATKEDKSGVYRPPKVMPTVMPTTDRREKSERRPQKSATLDEFVATEMMTAPVAEPSIGTNIAARGRKIKTASERKVESERRDYEERNFIRLPKESKKERAQKAKQEGRSGRMNFGGEDWRDLGEGVSRIDRLTKSKGSGAGTKALLDKSRKRGIDTVDGPRASGATNGMEMGDRYQKRLKVLEGGRRDRGKKR